MIQVENLVKTFDGFRALDGADFHVKKGAIYGLVGPNGAGKSTLIRHLTGIYKPVSYTHLKSIEAEQLKADVPEFAVGDTVKVHAKIKEGNRERIQVFEGIVLKRQGGSNRETFTVRKFSNGVGVEKTWPLHSPNVEKIEVVRRGKVRRAKLYYLRDRVGKRAKVKELVK